MIVIYTICGTGYGKNIFDGKSTMSTKSVHYTVSENPSVTSHSNEDTRVYPLFTVWITVAAQQIPNYFS